MSTLEVIPLVPLPMMFEANENSSDGTFLQEQISVLLRKEESSIYDYIYNKDQDNYGCDSSKRDCCQDTLNHNLEDMALSELYQGHQSRELTVADEICRLRMSEWCYKICDYLGASRAIVAIAFNYLDRFLTLEKFTCDSTFAYKLASITCLNIALKVHNRTIVNPSDLADLSRGEITVQDILGMESMILKTLSYNLCPPTCHFFIGSFYNFLPLKMRDTLGQFVIQKTFFLAELSVMDLSFKCMSPSHVAFGAILNVLDEIDDSLVSKSDRDTFVQRVEECLRIRCQSNSSVAGGKLMLNRARVMLAHMSKRSTSYDQLYLLENSYVTRTSATPTTVIPRKDSSFSHLVKDERIHAAENQQVTRGAEEEMRDDTDTLRSDSFS